MLKVNNFNMDLDNQDFQADSQYESQAKLFKQFLFKSSRYFSEQIFSIENCTEKKNLLLVKEIPNFAFYNVKQFQDILREYYKYSKFPLVFIITTQTNTKSSNPARLFSSDFVKELNIQEISFNSLAITYIAKHIDRIAKLENLNFVDKNFLEYLTSTCNGDLRNAYNILGLQQYPTLKESKNLTNKNEKTTVKKETKKSTGTSLKKEKLSLENNNKDLTLNIFRCLGKVLYRKDLEPSQENVEKFNAEKKLPSHLRKYQTLPMTCEPEEIYSKIPISDETFTMYLHQNYIEIFNLKMSDQSFETKFTALGEISDAFILADLLNARSLNFSDGSNSVSETKIKEIATIATMRSVLFNFRKDLNSRDCIESKPKSIWMPLYKPFTHKINEQRMQRIQQAEDILGKNQTTNGNVNSIYLNDINKEFFTTHLPFINLINSKRRGYLKDIRINDNMILFSKYKAVNSKTAVETDQSSFKENTTGSQQDALDTDRGEEGGNVKKRASSQTLTKTSEKCYKDDGIYESFEALSCIDENF